MQPVFQDRERLGRGETFPASGYTTALVPNNDAMGGQQPSDAEAFILKHLLAGGKTESDLKQVDGPVRAGEVRILRADIPATNGFLCT